MKLASHFGKRHKALCFLLTLLFLLHDTTSVASDKVTHGWFEPHCDGASFYLSKVEGLSVKQMLILNLRQHLPWWDYQPDETWKDVYAEQCSPDQKCKEAAHARLWLDNVGANHKRISGKYEVDFQGKHLEGKFLLKYRKSKPLWVCM